MRIDTHIERAEARVETEVEHVSKERRAYEQFRSTVESLSTTAPGSHESGTVTTAGVVPASTLSQRAHGADQCREVRNAFEATVQPYSVADVDHEEPVLETIREELGDTIALVLAPETEHQLTPRIQAALRSKIDDKQRELDAMERGLERETDSLRSARVEVDSIIDWLTEANETSLHQRSFPELEQQHESLETHRRTCESLLSDRQAVLRSTTSQGGEVGLTHRSLVVYLYQDVSVSFPILSTVTQLYEALEECQRTVRAHLIRRV